MLLLMLSLALLPGWLLMRIWLLTAVVLNDVGVASGTLTGDRPLACPFVGFVGKCEP